MEKEYYSDVTDREKLKVLNEYYKYDKEIRGEFLIQANWVEDFIEQIISKLLVEKNDEERRELLISILRRIQFSTKVSLLSTLMKKYLSEFKMEESDIFKELDEIKNIRNMFAHSVMDLRDEFLDSNPRDVVQYEFKKDGKTIYKKFTKKKLKECRDLVFKLTDNLVAIDVYLEEKLKKNY